MTISLAIAKPVITEQLKNKNASTYWEMHIAPLAQQELLLDIQRAPSFGKEWGSLLLRDRWKFRGTNSLVHRRKEKWETLTASEQRTQKRITSHWWGGKEHPWEQVEGNTTTSLVCRSSKDPYHQSSTIKAVKVRKSMNIFLIKGDGSSRP